MVSEPVGSNGRPVPVRKQQLVDLVVQQLEDRLKSGEFEIGHRMPSEQELATMFGVGRTTIREAIRVFSHNGMLEVRQGDGTYVRATAPPGETLAERLKGARVLDVFEVRRALELEAVGLAALRCEDDDLSRLRELVAQLGASVTAGNRSAVARRSIEFDTAIVLSTKNPVLIEFHGVFVTALQIGIAEAVGVPGAMERCLAWHHRLLEALSARDAQAARSVTSRYLDSVIARFQEIVDEHTPDADHP